MKTRAGDRIGAPSRDDVVARGPTRLPARPAWWRVRDVMTTHVVRAAPSDTYADVADLLLEHGITGVPVTDGSGRVLGVVSETDLLRCEAVRSERARPERASDVGPGSTVPPGPAETAAELMTCPPITASPDDDLPGTARKLLRSGLRLLPVVVDGRLVGTVSRRDLLAPAWDYPAVES